MARHDAQPNVFCMVSNVLDHPSLSRISATLGKSLYPTYAFVQPKAIIQKRESVITIVVSDMTRPRPFTAIRHGVIVVTLSDLARRMATYSQISIPNYVVLCALLGLVQESVLRFNDCLRREDLNAICSEDCYFSLRTSLNQYASVFEGGSVCDGCRRFYSGLGAKFELSALDGDLPRRMVPR